MLQKVISYTADAMKGGSMWWWIIPLAPGVPERLVVGHERAFLTWFYENATAKPEALTPEIVDEYLRTFSGNEGVLGSMGVYRAAFTTIDQTPMRMLCMCVPAGQDEFFIEVGDAVATRTSPPPQKTDAEKKASMEKSLKLAPQYATELLV